MGTLPLKKTLIASGHTLGYYINSGTTHKEKLQRVDTIQSSHQLRFFHLSALPHVLNEAALYPELNFEGVKGATGLQLSSTAILFKIRPVIYQLWL